VRLLPERRKVIGVDPTILFCMQHQAVQRFMQDPRNWVLPLKIEELPNTVQFDLTLSMGVLYHRRDPLQHVSHFTI
jgi:tRNA (mo5U34)-methyltransferase